jgi:hypothetical protein
MKVKIDKSVLALSLLCVGISLATVLSYDAVTSGSTSASAETQSKNQQTKASQSKKKLSFQVCGDFPDWQRPTEREQEASLRSQPRHNGVPVRNNYWTHNVLVHEVFGNSLMQDVVT